MSDTKKVLRAHFDALRAEKAAIEAKASPERAKLNDMCVAREKLTADIRRQSAKCREIEGTRIVEVSEEIARVALALGGKRMSDGAAANAKG